MPRPKKAQKRGQKKGRKKIHLDFVDATQIPEIDVEAAERSKIEINVGKIDTTPPDDTSFSSSSKAGRGNVPGSMKVRSSTDDSELKMGNIVNKKDSAVADVVAKESSNGKVSEVTCSSSTMNLRQGMTARMDYLDFDDEKDKYINGIPPWVTLYCEKTECEERAYGLYPCPRCYKANYCSEEHRKENMEAHEKECKIDSKLEGALNDKMYVAWHKLASGHLYDVCLNFIMVWPTPTVQFLPEISEVIEGKTRYSLLIGTQTDGEQNHLLICSVDVPKECEKPSIHDGILRISKRISHDGEVNKARYMPQNPSIVATKTPKSDVLIFDCSKHPQLPVVTECNPEIRLLGHKKEGFALAWNINKKGRLISGSYDNVICLWDVHGTPASRKSLEPISTFKAHSDAVGDVSWHCEEDYLFASVGDDKNLIIWDTRLKSSNETAHIIPEAHSMNINSVAFSPFSEFALATGSSDTTVAIWDLRNMKSKLCSLEYHRKEVYQVDWSPHEPTRLASAGNDSRVFVWDLNKLGAADQSLEDSYYDDYDEPKELFFIHGGHAGVINDICWNPNEPDMLCSASDNDNFLQIWKITKDLNEPENSFS